MPIRTLTHSGPEDFGPVADWLARRESPDPETETRVQAILDDVAARGDEALVDYTRRFDCKGFTASMLAAREDELEAALDATPVEDLAIIEEAAHNVRRFHEAQIERSWFQHLPAGAVLGQRVNPVDRAGLYVPGGRGGETPLISSILMNAIPAQVAGVAEITVVSPPRADGSLNPYILATCALLGLHRVVKAGSAWAVAAMAHGTATVPAVDVIAGPGNIHVTTAKRLLVGKVGIDIIAGPSEIAILADGSGDPAWAAADMLAQAEHDPQASCLCISPDRAYLEAVNEELAGQLKALPRAEVAAQALADWGALVAVPDMEVGLDFVNRVAPEHLELAVDDPWALVGLVRHAGAIFMGHHTAEPLGDYFAGPNHVLPTMGTARFTSALSVDVFTKKTSLIAASPAFARASAAKVARLARLEGLEAHARSAERRG